MTTTAEHTMTPAEDQPAAAGQDPLAELREAIAAARTEAGRLLACLRHTAGLSQARLAGRIGYSATVVAHAELGRRPVSAEFWELADDALAAGGKLTAQGARIGDLVTARARNSTARTGPGTPGTWPSCCQCRTGRTAGCPRRLPRQLPRSPRRLPAGAPIATSRSR
jgi:Helix-turn-helix domain